MSALQERAPSDKVAEVILSTGEFCAIYHMRIYDFKLSQHHDQETQSLLLIQNLCLFDDKQRTIAELMYLRIKDYNLIWEHLS